MNLDETCTKCGGDMIPTQAFDADDPQQDVQGMIGYECASCALEGVLIIRHDESDNNSGFVHLVDA